MSAIQQVKLSPVTRGLLVASAVAVLIFLAQSAQSILVPFLLAVFLAAIVAPSVVWLSDRGVPHILAVLLVALLVLIVVSGLGTIVGASVSAFTARMPSYETRLLEELTNLYDRFGANAPRTFRDLLPSLEPGAAMGIAASVLTGLSGVLGNVFLILFTMIFILLEAGSFHGKLEAAFGQQESAVSVFEGFLDNLLRYLGIKTVMSLATGMLVTLWLLSMGVDFPVMWGLLAFLLNYVPTIGSILAAVPAVLLSVIQFGFGPAILVAVGYLVINVFISNFVEPRLLGRGLGLSPLVVFLSLVFWGWVLGPVGMFLSVPMTMTVRMAFQAYEETRWLAVLLGPADWNGPATGRVGPVPSTAGDAPASPIRARASGPDGSSEAGVPASDAGDAM